MSKRTRYPAELRERAVQMLVEHRGDYQSEWAAISSVAASLGVRAETLRKGSCGPRSTRASSLG